MELVDIVNENNELTGQVEDRWVAYNTGLWRRTVSSWIMNKKGEVLLQKRSPMKERNPNKWAKTGGQVEAGESVEDAIFREVKEDLGIEIPKDQIKVESIYKNKGKIGRRFVYNFVFVVDYKIEEYVLQKEEVSDVRYFTIERMEMLRNDRNPKYIFNKWSNKNFNREIELLKNKRKEIIKNDFVEKTDTLKI